MQRSSIRQSHKNIWGRSDQIPRVTLPRKEGQRRIAQWTARSSARAQWFSHVWSGSTQYFDFKIAFA